MWQLEMVNREANLVAIAGAMIAKYLHDKEPRRERLATIDLRQDLCKGT